MAKKPKATKATKVRKSWPEGFKPKTRVKKSDKLYKRSKSKLKDREEIDDE